MFSMSFFLNQQFVTWSTIADYDSYIVTTLDRTKTKEKEREKEKGKKEGETMKRK